MFNAFGLKQNVTFKCYCLHITHETLKVPYHTYCHTYFSSGLFKAQPAQMGQLTVKKRDCGTNSVDPGFLLLTDRNDGRVVHQSVT